MLRRFLPFLLLALLVLTPAAQAAELPGDSAFVATALYIDAGDRDIPGLDLLNKGLNQVSLRRHRCAPGFESPRHH